MKQKQPEKQSQHAPETSQNASSSTAQAPVSNAVMQEQLAAADPFDPMSALDAATLETGMTDPSALFLWATRTSGLYDNTGYDTNAYDTSVDEQSSVARSSRDARRAVMAETFADSPVLKWFQGHGMGLSWAKMEHDLKDGPASVAEVPLTRTDDGVPQEAATYLGTNTPIVDTSAGGNRQGRYSTKNADLSKDGDVHTVKTDARGTTHTHINKAEFSIGPRGGLYEMNTQTGTTERRDHAQTDKNVGSALRGAKVRYEWMLWNNPPGTPEHEEAKAKLLYLKGLQDDFAADPSSQDRVARELSYLGHGVEEARSTNSTTITKGEAYSKGLHTEKDLTEGTGETSTSKVSTKEGFIKKKGLDIEKKRAGWATDTFNNRTEEKTNDDGYTRKTTKVDETSSFTGVSVDKGLSVKEKSFNRSSSDSLTGERKKESGASGFNTKEGLYKRIENEERDASGQVTTSSASGSLDADGVSGKVSKGLGKEADHSKVMTTASADGAITVTMVPVKGKKGSYKLITTLRVGGAVGTSITGNTDRRDDHPDAGKNSGLKGTAKVGVNGSVGAELKHVRVLDAEQAKAHMAGIDAYLKQGEAAGVPKMFVPQLEQLKKANAWLSESGQVSGMTSALGSGASAKGMKTGDEVSLVLQGSAGVDGELGAQGLSVGAEASASMKRSVTVTRLPKNKVQVVVAFEDATKTGLKGSAGYGMGKSKLADSNTASNGQSVTFVLSDSDEAFDTKYRQITGTATRAGLLALRRTYAEQVTRADASKGDGHQRDGGAEVGPVAFKVGENDSLNETLTVAKDNNGVDQTSYKATGSNGTHASVDLGKYVTIGSKNTEAADATVDAKGNMAVDISETTETTGLANPLDKLPADGSELWKRAHALDKELKKTEKHLATFKLSDADVRFLVAHAGDTGEWQRHAAWFGPRPFTAWNTLAARLQSPSIDPEWAGVDVDKAKKLAHAKAIATFMRTASGDGREIIESAVRNWGSPSLTGGEKGEFPPGMALTKDAYEALKRDGTTIADRMFALVSTPVLQNPDGTTSTAPETDIIAQLLQLDTELSDRETAARQAVTSCTTFKSADTKAEMLDAIAKVGAERRRGYANAYTELTRSGQMVPVTDDLDERFRQQGQRAELRNALAICAALKTEEKRHLDAAEAELASFFSIDGALVNTHLQAVEKSWDRWIDQVKKARLLYRALDEPTSKWKVSADGKSARSASHEPDVSRYNTLSQKHAHWKQKDAEHGEERRTKLTTY